MKKFNLLTVLLICCCLFISVKAEAARGNVVYRDDSYLGKIVIQIGYNSFTCGMLYSGYLTGIGDVIVGNLESYGMQDLYNLTRNEDVRFYVEKYWATEQDAIDWIKRGY